jgi:hypothetical protein
MAATGDATRDATRDAKKQNTDWYFVGADMRALARDLGVGDFGLQCAVGAWRMWQGGNQWSGYDAYLSFFQDIADLKLPQYETYQHWRTLTEKSGPRIVHEKFCMISDRPEVLLVDDRNRSHCETGPFCRWRDGTALYSIHGVRVPGWIIENPNKITIDTIHAEANSEIQRVMIERFGWDRYSAECGAEIVDHDERWGTLMRRTTEAGEPILFLRVVNRSPEPDGSFRNYVLPVDAQLRPIPDPARPEEEFGKPQKLTALNAVASTFGLRGKQYADLLTAES